MTPPLHVIVGTKNKAKLDAVREALAEYPHLAHAEVTGVEVDSGVSAQPKSLEETVRGAINRARSAFAPGAAYSIGIESGLMEFPYSQGGFFDICVCAISDGTKVYLGTSSAWEFPDKRITRLMVEDGLDMSMAINKAGYTTKATIGSEEGAIGILTKGRVTRKDYTKQALTMALIHLDPLDLAEPSADTPRV